MPGAPGISTAPKRRVLLVGWDAADWKVIHPLMDAGKMPTVKWLVEQGSMANLATLHPVLSPMLWTSIATGKRPAKHGINGFSEPLPDGQGVRPVTNLSRKTKAIWNILSQQGLRSNVVGWWPSHPAEPINGCMVSNHFQQATGPPEQLWPTMPGSVHPPQLTNTLAELRLNPNELMAEHILPFIPKAAEIDQEKDGRLASCAKILAEATSVHSVATHLMQHEPWDFMAVYYDAIDHFCHAFMRYYPPRQEHIPEHDFELYSGCVEAAYRYHDMMLHTLLKLAGPDVTVILMSDHGFHPDHLRPREIPAEPAGPAVEHRDFGIFAAAGPGICKDKLVHGIDLLDITPTLLALFGLPVGEDMDGGPALAALEDATSIDLIPSWDDVPGDDGRHPPEKQLDAVESAEAMAQLVALGYIEPPGPDVDLAVKRTVRELRYNLARSHMDANQHALAADILEQLYAQWPNEHRFGVQLALCLQAVDRIADMRSVVEILAQRRQEDAQKAQAELKEFAAKVRSQEQENSRAEDLSAVDESDHLELKTASERHTTEASESVSPAEGSPATEQDATDSPLKDLTRQQQQQLRQLRSRANYNRHAIAYLWGCVHFAEAKYEQAVNSFTAASTRQAHRPGLHLQIGEALLKLRRTGQAYESFRKAADIDPDNPHAWCGMARSALRARKNQAAIRHALKSIGLMFQNAMPHFTLGVALARQGETERSAEALQAAIGINPNFPAAHQLLAWLLGVRMGDPARAAEHRRLAKEMRQTSSEARLRQPSTRPDVSLQPIELGTSDEVTQREIEKPASSDSALSDHSPDSLPFSNEPVIVVSGLPRSGTSMVMQMLAAGGMPVFTDSTREADEDNPRGYFEHQAAKRLAKDKAWLREAGGKAVKIVAQLLPNLPPRLPVKVLLIERDLEEVLKSQAKMLQRGSQSGAALDSVRLGAVFTSQLQTVRRVMASRPTAEILGLQHAGVLADPASAAASINQFLGGHLDEAAMAAAVDSALYRNRS